MANISRNGFTTLADLNLSDTLGIQFTGRTSDPSDADLAAGRIYYNTTTGAIKVYNGTSWTTLGAAGAGAIPTWESIYGAETTFSITTSTWTISQSSNNPIFTLNKTGVGAGAVINVTNAGTGADILGNSSNWQVSAAGTGTFKAITSATSGVQNLTIDASSTGTITIAGTSTGAVTIGQAVTISTGALTVSSGNIVATSGNLTVTSGNFTVSAGQSALTSTSNTAASLSVVNNTITSYGVGGTGTGMVQFKSTSLTTGAILHVEASETNLSGGFYIQCWDSVAAANSFSVSTKGAIAVLGTAGSNVFNATNGNINLGAGSITVSQAAGATSLSVTNNTTTTNSLIAFAGSGAYTGNTTSSFMTVTASGLTTGTVLYLPAAALTTGKIINETANAITTGTMNVFSSTSAVLTSGAFASYTWNPATYTGAGITTAGLVSISDSPTISTSVSGTHNDLNVTRTNTTSAAVITYTVSGSIAAFINAAPSVGAGSTLTDSATVLDVQQNNTAASTGLAASFVQAAGAGGTNAVTITANSVTTSSGVVTVTANGLTTGKAMLLTSSGTIATTGSMLSIVANTATTSTGILRLSATGLTSGFCSVMTGGGSNITASGGVMDVEMGGATAGSGVKIVTSGAYTDTTGVLNLTANSLTGAGVAFTISNTGTGLTSGSLVSVTCGTTGAVATNGVVSLVASGNYTSTSNVGLLTLTANSTTAGTVMSVFGNGLTTGVAALFSGSGTYTGSGFFQITASGLTTGVAALLTANAATSGTLLSLSGTGLTTGTGVLVTAALATLTTGYYFRANDGANNVFGVGLNGHILLRQGTAPTYTAGSSTLNGLASATVVSGSTDTCGKITTTGTPTGTNSLVFTFNKTYVNAPRVFIMPANAAASDPNTAFYISAVSTSTFTVTVPAGGTYAATPQWSYFVFETGVTDLT